MSWGFTPNGQRRLTNPAALPLVIALWGGDNGVNALSATEIVTLLLIATTEKNSRSAKEQARASIDLSRETKALAEASLEQAKQSTTLSRETMELAKASHDLSQKMERLAKVAVGVALVSLVVAAVGIWQ